jgi:hypothetical protein
VVDALARLKERDLFTADDDLVFCSPVGGFADSYALRRRYYRTVEAAGLRRLHFHALHHAAVPPPPAEGGRRGSVTRGVNIFALHPSHAVRDAMRRVLPLTIALALGAAAHGCGAEGDDTPAQRAPTNRSPPATTRGPAMDQAQFWSLIGATRGGDPTMDGPRFADALAKRLAELPAGDIEAFEKVWREKSIESYRWDLWGAAYVINGGCSDDCFDYFRDFLISMGRDAYDAALRDPETLVDLPPQLEVEWEGPGYATAEAYEKVTGGSALPRSGPRQPVAPAGEEWTEDELPDRYPLLARKFGF